MVDGGIQVLSVGEVSDKQGEKAKVKQWNWSRMRCQYKFMFRLSGCRWLDQEMIEICVCTWVRVCAYTC